PPRGARRPPALRSGLPCFLPPAVVSSLGPSAGGRRQRLRRRSSSRTPMTAPISPAIAGRSVYARIHDRHVPRKQPAKAMIQSHPFNDDPKAYLSHNGGTNRVAAIRSSTGHRTSEAARRVGDPNSCAESNRRHRQETGSAVAVGVADRLDV